MSLIQSEDHYIVKINKEKLRISQQKYYEKNKELINERQRNKKRQQYQNDPAFREREKERALTAHKIKKNKQILENVENLKILEKV